MLSWPMIAFGWVTNMLQRGMASWKRMLEVLDTEPAIADSPSDCGLADCDDPRSGDPPDPQCRGEIEFRDLVVRLRRRAGARPRVARRSRRGRPSRSSASTGSGKSTLISLLARLHDPPPGHGVHRRRRRARHCRSPTLRGADRLRAAGAVSVLRHAGRQHRVRVGCGSTLA